jgi:hypothetical protein
MVAHASSGQPSGQQQQKISGYTPANFISYSEQAEDRCHLLLATKVDAPASVCFEIWNDWNRLVDFLDLVSQVGLTAESPCMHRQCRVSTTCAQLSPPHGCMHAQIGLDPNQPDMALFQCFYRWGECSHLDLMCCMHACILKGCGIGDGKGREAACEWQALVPSSLLLSAADGTPLILSSRRQAPRDGDCLPAQEIGR